jgi:hypothetical protein
MIDIAGAIDGHNVDGQEDRRQEIAERSHILRIQAFAQQKHKAESQQQDFAENDVGRRERHEIVIDEGEYRIVRHAKDAHGEDAVVDGFVFARAAPCHISQSVAVEQAALGGIVAFAACCSMAICLRSRPSWGWIFSASLSGHQSPPTQ